MAVRKVFVDRKRNGYTYDAKTGKYFSYKIDLRLADGSRIREKGFKTRADAENAINQIKAREKAGKFGLPQAAKPITLKQLFAARLADLPRGTEKTRAERVFAYFLELLPVGFLINELETSHLKKYIAARQNDKKKNGSPIAGSTIKREMKPIASALHKAGEYFAELKDWICPAIPSPKVRASRRERLVSHDELEQILECLYNPNFAKGKMTARARRLVGLILEFAHYSGQRHGDLASARKSYFNRRGRSLKIEQGKTGAIIYVEPLTERMIEILNEASEINSESDFIFTSSGAYLPRVYEILKDACSRAQIPYGRFTPDGIVFHDARHTFTTKMRQAGVDPATISAFTGHSTETMVSHYSHSTFDAKTRAMNAVNGSHQNELTIEKLVRLFELVREREIDFEQFAAEFGFVLPMKKTVSVS